MSKADVLRRISKSLSPSKVDFSAFDTELAKLKKSLEETVNIQTLDDVSRQLKLFQKKIDFTPLLDEMETIRNLFGENIKELENRILDKGTELIQASVNNSQARIAELDDEYTALRQELVALTAQQDEALKPLNKTLVDIQNAQTLFGNRLTSLAGELKIYSTTEEANKVLKDSLDILRAELLNRMSKIGGGGMNRQMFVGGVNYLTKYTDVNLKAGTNVTLTVADNNTTKQVDITITAAGGGSSFETPVGTVNDTNLTFTVTNTPKYINVNGLQYTVGNGIYTSFSAPTITLSTPVGTGGFIVSAY